MPTRAEDTRIHLAFRFHANFYHSYRGDTPDELGFGKDIRIIRKTIKVLDGFNDEGVPVCGTWDIENYFSLEKIMPEHCPDIIESLQRRVAEGKDEVQVMSYNNGLISAHTASEFDDAIGQAIANAAGSGLKDLFGKFGPMVRPQEMMYTPMHLKLYPAHGVDYISLYYSAVPFNGFSNFVKPLPFEQRYNPLTFTYPGIDETMTLMPAYNNGDIADNISLRWWLKRLRRKQLSMADPKDLLLLIDADADDDYWYGYDWPVVSWLLTAAQGLRGLVRNVCDLDFLTFTTPSEYVRTHPPVGEITIGQDTADGSFDGYSSWAEKWSNHQLWTGIERSRILELQARRLIDQPGMTENREKIEELLAQSREARLRALSTTHFGLSSPIMNVTRLRTGASIVSDSVGKASQSLELAIEGAFEKQEGRQDSADFTLIDYVRGVSTPALEYSAKPSRSLVRIPLSVPDTATERISLRTAGGETRRFAVRRTDAKDVNENCELLFVEDMTGADSKDFHVDLSEKSTEGLAPEKPVSIGDNQLKNEFISLKFDKAMRPVSLVCSGTELADDVFVHSAINYSGRVAEVASWTTEEATVLGNGLIALIRLRGEIPFEAGGEKRVAIKREFMLVSGLPYLYVDTHVVYPETSSNNYNKERARRLQREYDGNWREVMPCEIRPALSGKPGRPLRVWKHNYFGHMSCYDLDYGEFSNNSELDSFNNHITHAFVAVTDGDKGLLVAQTADVNASFAFCPMRTRKTEKDTSIFMNPFGSYHGKQLSYVTAFSGLGKLIALKIADQLDPYAPSYNGRAESFRLLIAPYSGDEPPEQIRRDAEAFAYPYAQVSRSEIIRPPSHRQWSYPA